MPRNNLREVFETLARVNESLGRANPEMELDVVEELAEIREQMIENRIKQDVNDDFYEGCKRLVELKLRGERDEDPRFDCLTPSHARFVFNKIQMERNVEQQ